MKHYVYFLIHGILNIESTHQLFFFMKYTMCTFFFTFIEKKSTHLYFYTMYVRGRGRCVQNLFVAFQFHVICTVGLLFI